ncbi:MAG TPA: aryl-sulfate sulfotransferase [Acidobacteriaceae bacterium]|jgi:hypothetical protein|nr:aryl-sulfate sulfotransferase [Acidobacteriaceae bacterium]
MASPSRLRPLLRLALASSLGAALVGCGTAPPDIGSVQSTPNPQVAKYTVNASGEATATVFFGTSTDYQFRTGTFSIPAPGGAASVYVAGMLANTLYHMRATVRYADGRVVRDNDHTFTTGAYPASLLPPLVASTTPGQTPQSGVEMLDAATYPIQIMAADLAGNVIWAYDPQDIGASSWYAPKQLPDGDFVALAAPTLPTPLSLPTVPANANLVREFDLAGNTVRQITMDQLNAELAAQGYNLQLIIFSHDVTVLPNGHWLVIATTQRNVVLTGATTPTPVVGDVIVDLDTNLQPVWVWNEFDHLDVNRHPWNFPDWTHTNALIYSKDDGNLLVSIRHQNWVVKVDYENGAGNGNILWHLGEGGDFKLVGGTDPTDWNYAQHGISFASSYTAGVFPLVLMDNGDDRMFPGDTTPVTCGADAGHPCYTTVPIFNINENNMTATLVFHQILPASLYSFWGGNAETLANGDVEYDLCASGTTANIVEVTDQPDPQTVWSLAITGHNLYRGYRLPSLYPGVQW